MRKIFFNLKTAKHLQLVKGCPTDMNGDNEPDFPDWNGDGIDNDDYNHDGETDQDDRDFYNGYMDGHDADMESILEHYDPDNVHDPYTAGALAGLKDHNSENPNMMEEDPGFIGGYY